MGVIKELDIKNQTCYFFDDMINIQNFQSNLLRIDKKPHKDFDIYYIVYITNKKIGNYKIIHSVNVLHLMMGPATGYFTKRNGEKILNS